MERLMLIEPSEEYAEQIEEYRSEYTAQGLRVTYITGRIPGMDGIERFEDIRDWLEYCASMKGKITWYMSVRKEDGKITGFCSLRHKLEYDNDDPEFASHIGYSVRPSERRKGYAEEMLGLVLQKAFAMGIDPVRLICSSTNTASARTITACGGVLIDSIYGEESGFTVNRYDISGKENI